MTEEESVPNLKVELPAAVTLSAEYETKLLLVKKCAICGAVVGDLNGTDGERPLHDHYAEKHPEELERKVVLA
jgi:hypothetical protein